MAAADPKRRRKTRTAPAQLDEASPGVALPETPLPTEAGEEEPHYRGHRKRLYARFLSGGAAALQDYELLEMILFAVNPQRDTKPLAKALLRDFGGLWPVFNAPAEKLRTYTVNEVSLGTDRAVAMVRAVGAVLTRAAQKEVMGKPVLSSWTALTEYLSLAMAHEPVEQFRLLFLDRKNALIADEVQQRGTVDHTPVYPREVVKRALELGATAIILVHNHPSGDPTPSRADIDMTKEIARAAHALGVTLHDHIVVGKGKHTSFKGSGLL